MSTLTPTQRVVFSIKGILPLPQNKMNIYKLADKVFQCFMDHASRINTTQLMSVQL